MSSQRCGNSATRARISYHVLVQNREFVIQFFKIMRVSRLGFFSSFESATIFFSTSLRSTGAVFAGAAEDGVAAGAEGVVTGGGLYLGIVGKGAGVRYSRTFSGRRSCRNSRRRRLWGKIPGPAAPPTCSKYTRLWQVIRVENGRSRFCLSSTPEFFRVGHAKRFPDGTRRCRLPPE